MYWAVYPLAAGFVREGTGQPGLADAGGPGDQHVEVLLDPLAGSQRLDQPLVESTWRLIVDVLQEGMMPQSCSTQPAGQTPVVALGDLPVDEQTEALLEAEFIDVGHGHLVGQRRRHAAKFEGLEFIQGGVFQHGDFLLQW